MKGLLFLAGIIVLLISACAPAVPGEAAGREVAVDGKSYRIVTVGELKTMLDNKDFLLVNTHIPYAGEIKGTDLFLPYNEIEQNLNKLPTDKSARIVLYCQSGNMSGIAAKALTRLGYTGIIDVEGGMKAWEKEGYELIRAPQ